jgi:hypothetical protein
MTITQNNLHIVFPCMNLKRFLFSLYFTRIQYTKNEYQCCMDCWVLFEQKINEKSFSSMGLCSMNNISRKVIPTIYLDHLS